MRRGGTDLARWQTAAACLMSGSPAAGRGRAVALGPKEVGKAGTIGELGLTLRRGNEQSPVGPSPSAHSREGGAGGGRSVLILGLVLLIIGWLTDLGILVTLGIILLVIGAVLWILGSMGRPVGGRRHYW
jgi:hypothetical protein